MSIDAASPLRQRMIEDMNARKLCAATQRGHIHSCKRFAASQALAHTAAAETSANSSCIWPRTKSASAIATAS